MLCRQQVAELAKQDDAFTQRNARLVVIGNGDPDVLKPFRKATGYSGLLYTDPTLGVYRTLSLKKSVGSLFGMQSFKQGFRSLKEGFVPGGIQGNAFQQGGALIVGPDDTIHYFHRNREAGDHPPIEDMLAACETSDILLSSPV